MSIWARLLQQAAGTNDPAAYLLSHDARTPLFYLEAMTRVLMHEHNPKKMRRLNEWFKKMEDALGLMDYYAGLINDFKGNRKIPQTIKQDLVEELKSATTNLNTLLIELGWLGEKADRVRKIHQYSRQMDWLGQKNLHAALKQRYQSDVHSITRRMKQPFEEIERDVHELRRDVRWLSIYPQAFKGLINLRAIEPTPEALLKYATPEIVQSPYNQLPRVSNVNKVLYLNTSAYYAMSWLIAQLGVLKDSGLRLLALAQRLQAHQKCSEAEALKNAQTILGTTQPSVDDLLNTARGLILQMQNDKVFSQLLFSKNTPAIKAAPVNKARPTTDTTSTTKPSATTHTTPTAKVSPKTRTTSATKPSVTTRATPTTKTSPKIPTTSATKPSVTTRATPTTKANVTARTTATIKLPATKTRTAPATKAPTTTRVRKSTKTSGS